MTGTLYFYTHVFSRLEYVISSAWCEVSMNVLVFVERTAAKPSNYLQIIYNKTWTDLGLV